MNRTRPKQRVGVARNGGLLLAEVLIALSIFTVCFLFILGVFPISVRAVHHSRCIFLANQVAQMRMDAVQAQPYATIPTFIGAQPGAVSVISTNNGSTEVINYSVTTTAIPINGDVNMLDVRTQVSWSEQTVTTNQPSINFVNIETIIANAP